MYIHITSRVLYRETEGLYLTNTVPWSCYYPHSFNATIIIAIDRTSSFAHSLLSGLYSIEVRDRLVNMDYLISIVLELAAQIISNAAAIK